MVYVVMSGTNGHTKRTGTITLKDNAFYEHLTFLRQARTQ